MQEPEDVDTQSKNENCLDLHDHEVPSLEYEASQLELVDDSDKDIIDFSQVSQVEVQKSRKTIFLESLHERVRN